MSSAEGQQHSAEHEPQPNMSKRHSLTIDANPLHLLPSNRRFSAADQLKSFTVKGEIFAKIAHNSALPEGILREVHDDEKKEEAK